MHVRRLTRAQLQDLRRRALGMINGAWPATAAQISVAINNVARREQGGDLNVYARMRLLSVTRLALPTKPPRLRHRMSTCARVRMTRAVPALLALASLLALFMWRVASASEPIVLDSASIVADCFDIPALSYAIPDVAVGASANAMLVVTVGGQTENNGCSKALTTMTVRYADVSLARAASAISSDEGVRTCTFVFYALSPTPGAAEVTIEFPGASEPVVGELQVGAFVLYGVAQQPPEAVKASGSESPQDVVELGMNTITPGAWVIDALTIGNQGIFDTREAVQAARWQRSCGASSTATSTSWRPTAGPTVMRWSHSSPSRSAHAAVAISQAGVADGGCGDGFCAVDEDDQNCAIDCGCAATAEVCGGASPAESPYGCSCGAICDCPDCDPEPACCRDACETCGLCETRGPICGDHYCEVGETAASCEVDCGCSGLSGNCDGAPAMAPAGCRCDPGCNENGECCPDVCDACGTCASFERVIVDVLSVRSACGVEATQKITLPAVVIAPGDNQALLVTIAGQGLDDNCNFGRDEVTGYLGATVLSRVEASRSGNEGERACNAIYYAMDPAPGTYDVVVEVPAVSGNPITNWQIGAFLLYGVAGSGPVASVGVGAPATVDPIDSTLPLEIGGAIILDVVTKTNQGVFFATHTDTGQREVWQRSCGSSSSAVSTKWVPIASLGAMGWKHSNTGAYAHSLAAFVSRKIEAASTTSTTTTTVSYTTTTTLRSCAQPVTTGSNPTATDCLYILNVAVEAFACNPSCMCAPKGNLPVTATDALVCLRKATGLDIPLDCPCGD